MQILHLWGQLFLQFFSKVFKFDSIFQKVWGSYSIALAWTMEIIALAPLPPPDNFLSLLIPTDSRNSQSIIWLPWRRLHQEFSALLMLIRTQSSEILIEQFRRKFSCSSRKVECSPPFPIKFARRIYVRFILVLFSFLRLKELQFSLLPSVFYSVD